MLQARHLILCLLLLVPATVMAETEAMWWHLAFVQARVRDTNALYSLEVQPRMGPETGQVIMRSAVGYLAQPWLQLWTGYAWTPTFDNRRMSVTEGRFFQQVNATWAFGPTAWTSRTRFEERSLTVSPVISFRFRTMLRGGVALDSTRTLSAVVWDEVFFNLNSVNGGPQRGFDQNRLFLGLAKKFGPIFSVEAGYLNQFVRRTSGINRQVHGLYTFTVWNLL
jgi:hypothetical protein